MSKNNPPPVAVDPTPPVQGGVRSVRAFQMKAFVPSPDWINKNVVAGGKGTKVLLGRIYGLVTGYEMKTSQLPDGTPNTSVVIKGVLESENYLTGELADASGAFFPAAFGEKIKVMFDADPSLKTVEIDCDVGLEATGKTIPYTWVIIQHVEGQASEPMKRLRASRGRPELAVKKLEAVAPKQLTAS